MPKFYQKSNFGLESFEVLFHKKGYFTLNNPRF